MFLYENITILLGIYTLLLYIINHSGFLLGTYISIFSLMSCIHNWKQKTFLKSCTIYYYILISILILLRNFTRSYLYRCIDACALKIDDSFLQKKLMNAV